MNDRIRKIEARAWEQVNRTNGLVRTEDFNQKFAELIMEEMYDFMCKATDNDSAWPSSKEVKQHFGVEE